MKIVLSRDEIKKMVAEKYGITADYILEISTENATKTRQEMITTVNSNNQVVDFKVEKPEEELKKKPIKNPFPEKTTVDYEKYALRIEEFLNSTGKTMTVNLEGLSLGGMEWRIRTAAKMYGLSGKFKITKSTKFNELYITKK